MENIWVKIECIIKRSNKIIKQKKIVLKVLLIGFAQMRDFKENFLFIVMVVAFLQKTFWISFLNYMKKRISKKIN